MVDGFKTGAKGTAELISTEANEANEEAQPRMDTNEHE
jgi:hypothetical protein